MLDAQNYESRVRASQAICWWLLVIASLGVPSSSPEPARLLSSMMSPRFTVLVSKCSPRTRTRHMEWWPTSSSRDEISAIEDWNDGSDAITEGHDEGGVTTSGLVLCNVRGILADRRDS
ncbi:hypothetical protein BD779DRAFT_1469444 [Infundibulicybe gibba]|nr:hypothetical protein BD779DRAFT_1469444 [Infundibulicybe gibba]